jgi:hypothetical protein
LGPTAPYEKFPPILALDFELETSAKIPQSVILRKRSDPRISKIRENTRSFAPLRMTKWLSAEVSTLNFEP